MNINKVNEVLEYWHDKCEKPTSTQKYNDIPFNTIIVFPSTNEFLKNYYFNEIKNLKHYYFISIYESEDRLYESEDRLAIIGIYDLDNNNMLNINEIGILFVFDEVIDDKWMDLKDFERYLERTIK